MHSGPMFLMFERKCQQNAEPLTFQIEGENSFLDRAVN